MRALTVSICLIAGIAATPAVAFAQADDETTPVYDFGDAGGVVVIDDGSSVALQPQPQAPARRGSLTVLQSGVGAGQEGAFWYYGPHPDPYGGWDPTEGAHAHDYGPTDEYLYTQENGYYYFIGDPSDFGYTGDDLYGYYGVHPIALPYGGGYCYYPGYHHHWWQPFGGFFAITNGWYWYNGPFSPWFFLYRDRYDRYFHDFYARRVTVAHPPATHYGRPPAPPPRQPPARMAFPVQRMRALGQPARPGWGYQAPPRPMLMRPTAARPMPAPAQLVPAGRPAPARVAPPTHVIPAVRRR